MNSFLRVLVSAGILTAAAVGYAQDLAAKVTYSTVATPVQRALKDISALAGVKLDSTTEMRSEIVVIDVANVTVDDLMQRIATATSGVWKKDSAGFYRLYRSNEVARAEQRAEAAARKTAIDKQVVKINEPLKEHPVWDSKIADEVVGKHSEPDIRSMASGGAGAIKGVQALFQVGSEQPAGRAVARLMTTIDTSILANIEEGGRVVFSTNPNRMQLGLGQKAFAVLNRMVAEQGLWASAYQRKNGDKPKSEVDAAVASLLGMENGPIKGTPVKALLCVDRQEELDSYELTLKLYDAEGTQVFSGGQSLFLPSSPINKIGDLLKTQPATNDPEIELTPDSKELLAYFRGLTGIMFGAAGNKELSPDLLAKLLTPSEQDPLSFIHSEALLAVARAQKVNLVADVPDSIMGVNSFMMPGGKLTVQGFLKALNSGDIVTLDVKDGWMVVKPARPVRDRLHRTNREALQQLVKIAHEKGYVPLDDMAAYALANRPLMRGEVTQLYAVLFIPGAITYITMGNEWDMLRLYGTLSPGQRQALGSGKALEIRSLLPAQSEFVRRMAYNPAIGHLEVKGQQNNQPSVPVLFNKMANEPTELLPNGLPSDGTVTVAVKSDAVAQDAGPKKPKIQLFGTLSAEEFGAMKMLKDEPTFSSMIGGFLPDLTQFRLGSRSTYDFKFQFTPVVSMSTRLSDDNVDPNSKVLGYGELPDDYRKKVEELAAAFKKSGGFPNIFGGGAARP